MIFFVFYIAFVKENPLRSVLSNIVFELGTRMCASSAILYNTEIRSDLNDVLKYLKLSSITLLLGQVKKKSVRKYIRK